MRTEQLCTVDQTIGNGNKEYEIQMKEGVTSRGKDMAGTNEWL